MYRLPVLLLLLLALPLLYACASPPKIAADGDIPSGPTFLVDDWVRRGHPQVNVRAQNTPRQAPTALFVPLRLTQPTEKARTVGNSISRQVWQAWLQQQVFPVIEFADNAPPYRADLAMQMARAKGAQVVIGGYITQLLDGGTAGDSRLSLQLEIYNVETGDLIWSMAHAGIMERQFTNDFILFAIKARMPSDPLAAITMTLARDMGDEVRGWLYPPPPKTRSNAPAFQ